MARNFGRPIRQIILHTTATSQQATVEGIKTFWATPKYNRVTGADEPYIPNVQGGCGWRQVGYHYLIGINGERHILAHLSEVTNGVRGYNWNSAHISYIGGAGGVDNRTAAQKREMKKLIQELRSDSILGPIPVIGHRDTYGDLNGDGVIDSRDWKKLCPSFDVSEWLIEDGVL